jgi:hypothetical protein
MRYLESLHKGREWTLPSGARLRIDERPDSDPTLQLMSWVVSLPLDVDGSNKRHATIQAFQRCGRSVILLQDGHRITSSGESQDLGPDHSIGPLFDELCRYLQREMRAWAPSPTNGNVRQRRGGRPRDADYDWAYQQLKSGCDQTQVCREWLKRIPATRRAELADPLDSFKKAMRYREKRE